MKNVLRVQKGQLGQEGTRGVRRRGSTGAGERESGE